MSGNDFALVAGDSAHPPVAAVVTLVREVMSQGAALGWSGVPTPDEAAQWWRSLLDDVSQGRAAVVAAWHDEALIGLGQWRRYPKAPQANNVDVEKVFVSSAVRGQGVGTELMLRLIDAARRAAVEQVTLDCRGNNHGAIRLYERLGFVEWGRLVDFVASGSDRWDKVHLVLDLRTGDEPTRRHGRAAIGEGSSA